MDNKLIYGLGTGLLAYLMSKKSDVIQQPNTNIIPVTNPIITPTVILPTPSTVVNPVTPVDVVPINTIQPYVPSLPQGIFWSEDFENGLSNDGVGLNPWDTTGCQNIGPVGYYPNGCPGGHPQITTAEAHSGTHSLWSHYEYTDSSTHAATIIGLNAAMENAGLVSTHAGTFINRYHTPTNNVWMRWYQKYVPGPQNMPGVQIDFDGKQMYNKSNSDWLIVWHMRWDGQIYAIVYSSASVPAFCDHSGRMDTSCNYYSNMNESSNFIPDGQWHCIETHADTGDNSGPNNSGTIEIFIDGIQVLGYYNVPIAQTPGQWDHITHYAQAGYGDRYIDDLVVAGQRIGP